MSIWWPTSALENKSPGHRWRVLWRCPWQDKKSAHLSSVQKCHSQDATGWISFLWWDSLESVAPILTQIQQSLWYADKKTDSLPLRPIVWRSRMMPYCRVVPYPFSKLKKRPTVCCLCAKASQIYLSRLTRWFILWQCFLKPHWLLFIIPDFSRYQMKRVLYQLA